MVYIGLNNLNNLNNLDNNNDKVPGKVFHSVLSLKIGIVR